MFSLKNVIAMCLSSMGLLTAAAPVLVLADTSSPPAAATAPAAESSQQVTIDNFAFEPATLTIPAGTKVTWTNRDDAPHTVTSTTHTFSSKALDTDDQFSYVFAKAGTYSYFCAVHPHMKATVIVK